MTHSGLVAAGTILLLVGAILSAGVALGAAFIGYTTGAPLMLAGSAFLAIGAILGFVAWRQAKRGRLGAAFGFGLASALLPPLQILQLIGTILLKVAQGNAPPQSP